MYEAARKGDQIEHSSALAGLIAGVVVGAVVGALTVTTGGLAAIAFAAMTAASTGGFLGQIAGGFLKHKAGPIATGAQKVLIGRRRAARAKDDKVDCHPGNLIAQGSRTVMIENFPAARIDDKTACDGKIAEGFPTVRIGMEPGTYVEIGSEVPWQLEVAVMALGLIPGLARALMRTGLKALAGRGLSFLKGLPGKLKNGVSRIATSLKKLRGHPVDVATGDVVDGAVDLSLPGVIPVVWARDYCSARAAEEGPLGAGGWTHDFDQWVVEDGELWTLRTEGGRDVYFEKVSPGETTFHRRERLELTAHGDGAFSVYSLETKRTRFFSPPSGGEKAVLRAIRDAYGNEVALYYDGARLERVIDTAGRRIEVRTDSLGRITRLELWAGDKVHQWVDYDYSSTGELASATDALGHAARFQYDAQHRMTRTTLKNGVTFHYEYHPESGRCIRTWGDNGLHTVELSYDVELGKTVVSGNGEPRIYYWDDFGMVRREATPDGGCLRIVEVDDDGHVLAEGVTEAELTRCEYDARGNRTKVVDAAGNVTSWEYDGDRPRRRIDASGSVTAYAHDARGALAAVTYQSGITYSLTHDLHGRLTSVRHGDRVLTELGYDLEHNVTTELDARRAQTRYDYDACGRAVIRTDALGRETRVEYDSLGQATAIHAPDGTTTRAEYEPLGNISRAVDALGQVTEMEYAGTGVLARVVQPDGHAWTMQYDRDERLSEVRNPHDERYVFAYDEAGRVISERTFDGRTLGYEYSETGRLASIAYPDHSFRLFKHDALGNVIGDRGVESNITFERDKLGRLVRAVSHERSGKVVTEIERDNLGRVITEKQNGRVVRFAHDARGRRVERTLPDGATTRYEYDDADALVAVEHGGRRFTLDRDVLGRETSRRASDGGVEIRRSYDAMDRLVEQQVAGGPGHMALSRRTWKYDALGRVQEIGDDRWGHTLYHYDSIGQLIEATRGKHREVFRYDITGSLRNILDDLTQAGHARPWDTESGNLLTRTDTARYEYDARGRRVRKGALVDASDGERAGEVTEYAWDERDRLREVRKATGERLLFSYDALGRRVRKEVVPAEGSQGRRVVEFVWDGDELAADLDSNRGARVFVHEPGTFVPMLQAEQGEVFAVVNDHLGMPKELVDQDGRVAWSAAHSAWGRVVEEYRDPSARRRMPVESPFRLLGQYADKETGLCYTRFRYFDPEVGRWCSPDPLGIVGDRDSSQFGGAPSNALDPLGLCVLDEANFAQKTFREVFSAKGREELSKIAGRPIRTIDDLAGAIKSGLDPKKIPVNYVVRDKPLIANTRTAQALERAGVPRKVWQAVDKTGDPLFEELVSGQLSRNGLGNGGIPFVLPEP